MFRHFGVGTQIRRYAVCQRCHLLTPCGAEVCRHLFVVREETRGGAHLGTHIAYRRLARTRKRRCALAEIFDNGIRATLNGKYARKFENDVLWRRPSAQRSCEAHTDTAGNAQFPFHTCQDVNSICATHTDGYHAQPARIRRVRVSAHHHTTREGIIFQHYLMDNARSWCPESHAVTCRSALQKVIHLSIFAQRTG